MTRIRVSSLAELAPVVPHLLGFVPTRSLVVLGLTDGRVVWTQRADLVAGRSDVEAVAAQIVTILDREAPERLLVLAFEDAFVGAGPLLETLRGLAPDWWEVAEIALVRGDRVVEVDAGTMRPRDTAGTPVEPAGAGLAELVLSGSAPAASRQERVDSVACHDPGLAARVRALVPRWLPGEGADTMGASVTAVDLAPLLEAWRHLMADPVWPDVPDEDLVARLVATGRCVPLRDALLGVLAPRLDPAGTVDALGEQVLAGLGPERVTEEEVLARLLRVCRVVDGRAAAGFLAMVGTVAWAGGDGVLAGAVVGRALALEPGHSLAGLVRQVLVMALSPALMAC